MSEFKREDRYIVVKLKHLAGLQVAPLRNFLRENRVPTLDCVVVESDWPEYEPVWKMIERRMTGQTAVSAAEEPDAVLHWRGKHAQAIRERDALQKLLNQRDEQVESLKLQHQSEAEACAHEWTDDGEHLLVCTVCGAQEDHAPGWRDMATAPTDGTMVRLLVEFEERSTEDAEQATTIGANNLDNDEEDVWRFAGWCWSHDHFTEGKGMPIGWLPMLDGPKLIPVAEQPAPVVPELTPELRWILGQMCFQCIHTAQALRLMGHDIAKKAEDEQAATIFWMLGHYLKDPANWRENAAEEMKAAAPKA